MAQKELNKDRRLFGILDKFLWVCWVFLPIYFLIIYRLIMDPGTYTAALTPEELKCIGSVPNPSGFSAIGQVVYWLEFGFVILFYAVLMAMLHRLIRRFAHGQIFVSDTLSSLQMLGAVLIIFPFAQSLVGLTSGYILSQTDGVPVFLSANFPDIGPIAVGVFLIALKYVLEKAIAMKTENDMTI